MFIKLEKMNVQQLLSRAFFKRKSRYRENSGEALAFEIPKK